MSQYKTKISSHYQVFIYYARFYLVENTELPAGLQPSWNGQELTLSHSDNNVARLAANTVARLVKQYYFFLYTDKVLDKRQKEELDKLKGKKMYSMLAREEIIKVLEKLREDGNKEIYEFYMKKIKAPHTVGFVLNKHDLNELEAALNPKPKEIEEVRPGMNEKQYVMDLDDKGVIRAYLLKLLKKPQDFDVRLKGVNNRLAAVGRMSDCKNFQRFVKESFNKMTICVVEIDNSTHKQHIDKLREQMPSFLGASIFSQEQLLECCEYFQQNFKLKGPKEVFNSIKESKPSFIFVTCYEIYKDKVKSMINKYLMLESSSEEERLLEDSEDSPKLTFTVQNSFSALRPDRQSRHSDEPKPKYVEKQELEKPKVKSEKEPEKRQRREDMERLKKSDDEDDGFIPVTKKERVETKKVIASKIVNQNEFDEKDFSNWFYRNKVVNPHDMVYMENGDKITINLTAFGSANNKEELIRNFEMYFNFDKMIFLKKQQIEATNKFVEHFKKINPSCVIKVIKGYCPYKYDELLKAEVKKKMFPAIQKDNIKKGGHNIHEFSCLVFKGMHNLGNLIEKGIETEVEELKRQERKTKTWIFLFSIIPQIMAQPKIRQYCQKKINNQLEISGIVQVISCKWQGTTVQYKLKVEEGQEKGADSLRKTIELMIEDKFIILPIDVVSSIKELQKIHKVDQRKYQLAEHDKTLYIVGFECEGEHHRIEKKIVSQEQTKEIVIKTQILQLIGGELDKLRREYNSLAISVTDIGDESAVKVKGLKLQVEKASSWIRKIADDAQSSMISVESSGLHEEEIKVLNQKRILEKLAQEEKVSIKLIEKDTGYPTLQLPNGCLIKFVNKSSSSYGQQNVTIAMDSQTWHNITSDDLEEGASCKITKDKKVCFVRDTDKIKQGFDLCQTDHIALIPNQETMQNLVYRLVEALMMMKNQVVVAICCRGTSNFEKAMGVFDQSEKSKKIEYENPKRKVVWSWIEGKQVTPYNDKVNEQLNKAMDEDRDVVYVNEKTLGIKQPTHVFSKRDVTLTYLRTGDKFNVTKTGGYYFADVNGVQFKIEDSSVIDGSKENEVPIAFMVYRIYLKELKQVNVFTEYTRKICKNVQELTVALDLSACKFYRKQKSVQVVSVRVNKNAKKGGHQIIQRVRDILDQERVASETLELRNNVSVLQKIKDTCAEHGIRQELVKKTGESVVCTFSAFSKKDIELIKHMHEALTKKTQEIEYPPEWVRPKEEISLHVVPKGTKQFAEVEDVFKKSTGVDILELRRVENRIIWRKYQGEKMMLEEVTGVPIKEEMLFHGTRKNDPANVYEDKQQAFNINYSGDSNYFGRGIYFAREARYSHSYHYNDKGNRVMLYCRVLVGQSHVRYDTDRSNSIKDTQYRDPVNKIRYQSNFSTYDGSDIYIVYKSRRAYPSYIIKY